MVNSLYLMSSKSNSGKTAVSIGLFLTLKENGKNPGYFKPIGDPFSDVVVTKSDKDVSVIHKLLERKYSKEEICPIMISPSTFLDEIPFEKVEGVKELIKRTYDDLKSKVEIVIIEGNHDYTQFHTLGLNDLVLAKLLESEVILLSRLDNDTDIDRLLIGYDQAVQNGLNVIGTIFSSVSILQEKKIAEKYSIILKEKGIELLGTIPQSRLLSSPTIGEILDAIRGTMLTDDINVVKDNAIENFIIGAMQSHDALSYMRKFTNLGVITGGDRADIILMSIELGVSLIVLTGNLKPDVTAVSRAKEEKIPIILVSSDTYTTAKNIQNINTKIQQGEVEICKNQIIDHVNWKKIFKIK